MLNIPRCLSCSPALQCNISFYPVANRSTYELPREVGIGQLYILHGLRYIVPTHPSQSIHLSNLHGLRAVTRKSCQRA
jgi:hypothetical protein